MVGTSVKVVLGVVFSLIGICCLVFLGIWLRMKKDDHDVEKALAARQESRPAANHPIRNVYNPIMTGQLPISKADEVRMKAERMVDRVQFAGRLDDETRRIQEEWRVRMQMRVQEQERRDQFQWM